MTSSDPSRVPAAEERRIALLATRVGAAAALGSVAAAGLALVWVAAFPMRGMASDWGAAGLVGAVAVGLVCLLQWLLWGRAVRRGGLAGARVSWWAHVASYPAVLLAVVGLCGAASIVMDPAAVGMWLFLAAAALAAVGQATGAVQFLRAGGPPGTLRAHAQRIVARSNARGDAEAAAAERRVSED